MTLNDGKDFGSIVELRTMKRQPNRSDGAPKDAH
jgi:hypothetical protein